uniref:RRM domain-containing protein n=1 Tax=Alexandrium catenella TaxID=2925 RepID=A0A7S1PXQ9_ALECA
MAAAAWSEEERGAASRYLLVDLPMEVTEDDLRLTFGQFGVLAEVVLKRHPTTQEPRASVKYANPTLDLRQTMLHRTHEIRGKAVTVQTWKMQKLQRPGYKPPSKGKWGKGGGCGPGTEFAMPNFMAAPAGKAGKGGMMQRYGAWDYSGNNWSGGCDMSGGYGPMRSGGAGDWGCAGSGPLPSGPYGAKGWSATGDETLQAWGAGVRQGTVQVTGWGKAAGGKAAGGKGGQMQQIQHMQQQMQQMQQQMQHMQQQSGWMDKASGGKAGGGKGMQQMQQMSQQMDQMQQQLGQWPQHTQTPSWMDKEKEVTSRYLLTDLPSEATEEELRNYFSTFGGIEEVTLKSFGEAGNMSGSVKFFSPTMELRKLMLNETHEIRGKRITVQTWKMRKLQRPSYQLKQASQKGGKGMMGKDPSGQMAQMQHMNPMDFYLQGAGYQGELESQLWI